MIKGFPHEYQVAYLVRHFENAGDLKDHSIRKTELKTAHQAMIHAAQSSRSALGKAAFLKLKNSIPGIDWIFTVGEV